MKSHRLKKSLKKNANLQDSLLTLLSKDSLWIYSLMKSGTTYSALFLSNYFNYVYGDKKGVDFDHMNKAYCIHSLESNLQANNITQLLSKSAFHTSDIAGYQAFFTTHVPIHSGLFKKNISLIRNPLDYIISSYYFHYVNRGRYKMHPINIAQKRIRDFARTVEHQNQLKENYPDKVLQMRYETLVTQPEESFKQMIQFLDLEFDDKGIEIAMHNSSKKKVKEMEAQRGEAIVKKNGSKYKGSFIRSGKIGEWKEYFSDKHLNRIDKELNKYQLSLSDYLTD